MSSSSQKVRDAVASLASVPVEVREKILLDALFRFADALSQYSADAHARIAEQEALSILTTGKPEEKP